MMTLPQACSCAQALKEAQALGLDRLDAQLLLLHVLGKPAGDRTWLLTHDTHKLTPDMAAHFDTLSRRRAGAEPLAYIVGNKEFFGLNLQVDPRVLVPRPDTETLVQWSLDVLAMPEMPAIPDIVDLGTGSGAIALAIAHSLRKLGRISKISAVDASAGALEVARSNAEQLQLDVRFIEGHWLNGIEGRFHLIASNPPYIAEADPHLAGLRHEPEQALTSGPDGLDDIRQIITDAPAHLHDGGWLLLEHGYDQAQAVRQMLVDAGFLQVQSRRDLSGIERCSAGKWPADRQHSARR